MSVDGSRTGRSTTPGPVESLAPDQSLRGGEPVHVEVLVFMGWASAPAIAYGASLALLRRSVRQGARTSTTAADRLDEMRRRPTTAGARGRMAEAVRLAEGPLPSRLPARRG